MFPQVGKNHISLPRLIYLENYGEIPAGYDIHHLFGQSNDPKNLLSLPHSLHSKIHWMMRRGENIDGILQPYFLLRESQRLGKEA